MLKRFWKRFWHTWWISGPVCGALLGVAGAMVLGYFHDLGQQRERRVWDANAPQRELDKVPRKVSAGEGCEVLTFNPDGKRWLYFTKCPGYKTVTTTTWKTCTGGKHKTCTEHQQAIPNDGD